MSNLGEDNLLDNIPKIQVIVRKRGLNLNEKEQKDSDIIEIKDNNTLILKEIKTNLDLSKTIEPHIFKFDYVFDENSTNEKIYLEIVRPMIKCVFFKKSKISIFAYGQTGSGKTYTMMGNSSNKNNINYTPGLYSFAIYDIFQLLSLPQFSNYYLTCSFYEIYCGKLYDLFNNKTILNIREDGKQNINIIGLTEKKITDFDNLINLIELGLKNRTIGITKVNKNSSRSHGIIQINIYNKTEILTGKITFIDLAGSERESDKKIDLNKQTRIDGAEINKSLLALKECIRALVYNKKHLPFRGSKLTLVLKDSFIGNCKTLMIANINSSNQNCDHTLNTLRYAERVKEIKCKFDNENKNNNINNQSEKHFKFQSLNKKKIIGNLINNFSSHNIFDYKNCSYDNLNKCFNSENKENILNNNFNNFENNCYTSNKIYNNNNNFKNLTSPINLQFNKKFSVSTTKIDKIILYDKEEEQLKKLENKHEKILNELLIIEEICVDKQTNNIIELGKMLNDESQIIQNYKNGNINILEYIRKMKKIIHTKIIKLQSIVMNFDKFYTKIECEKKINENINKIKNKINDESFNSFCLFDNSKTFSLDNNNE